MIVRAKYEIENTQKQSGDSCTQLKTNPRFLHLVEFPVATVRFRKRWGKIFI